MRRGTLCLVAIGYVVLSGCSSTSPELFKLHPVYLDVGVSKIICSTPNCSLTVTVNDCTKGDIQVTDPNLANGPDIDISSGPTDQQRSITWTIATAGYEFSNEPFKYGIVIKSDPGDEFKNVKITNAGAALTIQFKKKGTAKVYYRYGLQLRSTSSNKDYCQFLDPWLIS